MLSSLPQRFNMKVTVIEKANDIATLKIDELFSPLRTFEFNLSDSDNRRDKGVALHVVGEENIQQHE